MIKLSLAIGLVIFLFFYSVTISFAAPPSIQDVVGVIEPPSTIEAIGPGATGINRILNIAVNLFFTVASVLFVAMVLYSGLQWILSGGDKEQVAGAQKRLTYAVLGIVFLAFAFFILKVIGDIIGFRFFASIIGNLTTFV